MNVDIHPPDSKVIFLRALLLEGEYHGKWKITYGLAIPLGKYTQILIDSMIIHNITSPYWTSIMIISFDIISTYQPSHKKNGKNWSLIIPNNQYHPDRSQLPLQRWSRKVAWKDTTCHAWQKALPDAKTWSFAIRQKRGPSKLQKSRMVGIAAIVTFPPECQGKSSAQNWEKDIS